MDLLDSCSWLVDQWMELHTLKEDRVDFVSEEHLLFVVERVVHSDQSVNLVEDELPAHQFE